MATADENVDGLGFLSDPVDRFPLPDLAAGDFTADGEAVYTRSAAESSMGDVGDAPLTFQLAINNGCEALSLSATDWHQSTGKDDPQAPGWTKRVCIDRAPIERTPCTGRVCALEKSLRGYAEKKTDTVVVPAVGYSFDSLGQCSRNLARSCTKQDNIE